MPQIVPIKDLRDTTTISKKCHERREPIFVTKNGYGDMVIMSMETYEETMAETRLYNMLAEREQELEEGKMVDADEVFKKLEEKHFGKRI